MRGSGTVFLEFWFTPWKGRWRERCEERWGVACGQRLGLCSNSDVTQDKQRPGLGTREEMGKD